MASPILLLPMPRRLRRRPGTLRLKNGQFIRLLCSRPAELTGAAVVIQAALQKNCALNWNIVAGPGGPNNDIGATVTLNPAFAQPEGYRLAIGPDGIAIMARTAAGAFYGAQTLAQLLQTFPSGLPALAIEDWPDFPVRGVMIDISRDKVPSFSTLCALIDKLASWKVNQFQLYMEHTFAYRAHPEVWAQASPLTGEEILRLDAYCRARHIDLAPNQNSFGHLERWLKFPRYLPLAEAPNGFDCTWGHFSYPRGLCPIEPRALELLEELYGELLPHFTSRLFNVGCDETLDLGTDRSKAECEKRGKGRVYLDFLKKIYRKVKAHGRTMQFWGDIILHYPKLIPELPKDIIALEWGYEAGHPFDKDCSLFRKSGIPFYVCPGTSSWISIAGRTDNCLANLRNAAENGLKHGAIGYLNTDWGDYGHLQYLPVSYLGFGAGAAYSWCFKQNAGLDIAAALSRYAFNDRAGVMGQIACDLGNVYQQAGKIPNASRLFGLILKTPDQTKPFENAAWRQSLLRSLAAIDRALAPLDASRMECADGELVASEFRNAAALLRHLCRAGLWRMERKAKEGCALARELRSILGEHRRLWLARNRPGGLSDSCKRLEERLEDYKFERVNSQKKKVLPRIV